MVSTLGHSSRDLGNPEASLSNWSKRYRRPLLAFFRRRVAQGGYQEDLVQEVFLRLAKRQDLHEIHDVDRYVFQSAANVLADWRRYSARRGAGAHTVIDDQLPDVGGTPENVLMGRDSLRLLVEAVATMPSRTQTIFALYHFKEQSHAEIARSLGLAVRTVEDHIARANRLLKSVLQPVPE
jgi:RNA polymerase sigma factor (sigma-70 family)